MASSPSETTWMEPWSLNFWNKRLTIKTSLGLSSASKTVFSVITASSPFRQFKPEFRALAYGGLDPDAASHALYGLAHDCQSDPCSLIGLDSVQTLKRLENALVVFGRDSDALVLDP